MSNGYVYAARVPGDRLVKIGRTIRSPEERLSQLNNTSVPRDYENEFVLAVGDPVAVERAAHQILRKCRLRDNREFFQCSPRKARSAIRQAAAGVKGGDTGSIVKRVLVDPIRTLARCLFGTILAVSGLVLTTLLLFVFFVDPIARSSDHAATLLVPLVLSMIALVCGIGLMRKRS